MVNENSDEELESQPNKPQDQDDPESNNEGNDSSFDMDLESDIAKTVSGIGGRKKKVRKVTIRKGSAGIPIPDRNKANNFLKSK